MFLGAEENFQKYALGSMIDHLNQPYDYDSIMHYQPNSFSKDSTSPTITPKIEGAVIGQRDHLSDIDIKMIQNLYGCTNKSMLQITIHISTLMCTLPINIKNSNTHNSYVNAEAT